MTFTERFGMSQLFGSSLTRTFSAGRWILNAKTTTGWRNTPFHMSSNEVEFAQRTNHRYSIIRLYDFWRSAKAFQIENPIEQSVHLRADGYKASFR